MADLFLGHLLEQGKRPRSAAAEAAGGVILHFVGSTAESTVLTSTPQGFAQAAQESLATLKPLNFMAEDYELPVPGVDQLIVPDIDPTHCYRLPQRFSSKKTVTGRSIAYPAMPGSSMLSTSWQTKIALGAWG